MTSLTSSGDVASYICKEGADSWNTHQHSLQETVLVCMSGWLWLSCCGQSILRYRSDLLRQLGTLLFLPAFLSGAAEQKQVLEVELFSDFTDDPVSPALLCVIMCEYFGEVYLIGFFLHVQYAPSVTAVIEILSNKVQIYSSQLQIHAHFTGIRWDVYTMLHNRYIIFFKPKAQSKAAIVCLISVDSCPDFYNITWWDVCTSYYKQNVLVISLNTKF